MRVLVFGDSIAYGAWSIEGGWVEQLKKYAHKKTVETLAKEKLQVINLGIGGDSSTRIAKRLESEIESRETASWPLVLVFQFCANDARSINGVPETKIDDFMENVENILQTASKKTSQIIFVGEPLFAAGEITFKGVTYSSEKICEYEDILQRIVQKHGFIFISVRNGLSSLNAQELISFDGIHPNDVGHDAIYNLVLPEIEKLVA